MFIRDYGIVVHAEAGAVWTSVAAVGALLHRILIAQRRVKNEGRVQGISIGVRAHVLGVASWIERGDGADGGEAHQREEQRQLRGRPCADRLGRGAAPCERPRRGGPRSGTARGGPELNA
ncbi:unnamed protein product [Prorocentrum cordatum]|uniref:Uncharacterized protein n=1 Tax=Prorocentrum cordatum TaxID=2364126 RepID=A0ABN9SLI6_9DINO|nr:unnamed protein product [Polarella glacialis]